MEFSSPWLQDLEVALSEINSGRTKTLGQCYARRLGAIAAQDSIGAAYRRIY